MGSTPVRGGIKDRNECLFFVIEILKPQSTSFGIATGFLHSAVL